MKKIIALLLVGAMCLLFVGCGNNNENTETDNKAETNNIEISKNEDTKKAIVGVWKDTDNNYMDITLIINDDNTGIREIYDNQGGNNKLETDFKWKYSNDLDCYVIIHAGNDLIPIYVEDSGENEYISYLGEKCYRTNND